MLTHAKRAMFPADKPKHKTKQRKAKKNVQKLNDKLAELDKFDWDGAGDQFTSS